MQIHPEDEVFLIWLLFAILSAEVSECKSVIMDTQHLS